MSDHKVTYKRRRLVSLLPPRWDAFVTCSCGDVCYIGGMKGKQALHRALGALEASHTVS